MIPGPETPTSGSLVLYKQKPARVSGVSGDKLELETQGGPVRVRPKDVLALHPGPVTNLLSLRAPEGEPAEVWALLDGEALPLADVAELAFGAFTPESALAVWRWVQDGTYFGGTPQRVAPKTPQEVQATLDARQQRARAAQDEAEFLNAVRAGQVTDARRLADVEALALGRAEKSRTLAALGRPETPQSAHALLLALGVWNETRNPFPARFGATTSPPDLPVPSLPQEDRPGPTARPPEGGSRLDSTARPPGGGSRLDLTHLTALAIDDEGSLDPDDAISLEPAGEGWRLWVHVADAAALVEPGSELDREARARGATLYLPEGNVPMLPPGVTDALGLGLQRLSPALSFALDLDADFAPHGAEVVPSWVRVERLTYAQAQAQLDDPQAPELWRDLGAFSRAARARREEAGAVLLELPEVRVRMREGQVTLTPLPPLESRAVVQEAMMLAGWGAASWAEERGLALPFAAQDPPLSRVPGATLSAQWARRKTLSRTRFAPRPGPHAGLGLALYAQATSPLRRALDLVVHQQLRAQLAGERPLSGAEIAARAAEADLAAGAVRAAERASNRFWTLVFLRQHPGWRGAGVVVERRGPLATVLLPELALDAQLPIPQEVGTPLTLEVAGLDLAELNARWRVAEA